MQHFPKESEAPVIVSSIRVSLCRLSPGVLWWLSAQRSEQLSFGKFPFFPWQVCSWVPSELVVRFPIRPEDHSHVFRPQQSKLGRVCCCLTEKGCKVFFALQVRDAWERSASSYFNHTLVLTFSS